MCICSRQGTIRQYWGTELSMSKPIVLANSKAGVSPQPDVHIVDTRLFGWIFFEWDVYKICGAADLTSMRMRQGTFQGKIKCSLVSECLILFLWLSERIWNQGARSTAQAVCGFRKLVFVEFCIATMGFPDCHSSGGPADSQVGRKSTNLTGFGQRVHRASLSVFCDNFWSHH